MLSQYITGKCLPSLQQCDLAQPNKAQRSLAERILEQANNEAPLNYIQQQYTSLCSIFIGHCPLDRYDLQVDHLYVCGF